MATPIINHLNISANITISINRPGGISTKTKLEALKAAKKHIEGNIGQKTIDGGTITVKINLDKVMLADLL